MNHLSRAARRLHDSASTLATLLVVLLIAVAPVAAQGVDEEVERGPVTWGISPATADGRDTRSQIEHVVSPGATLVEHVVVDNYGDEALVVDLYAADARQADGAFDVMAADEPSEAVGTWVELSRSRIEVPARSHVIVEATLRVPTDAGPGDHAGGILASRRSVGAGADVGIETERRVGTRVHIRVAGPISPALSVTDLHPTYRHRLHPAGRGSIPVSYRVENTGNIRLSGETSIVVTGPLGLGGRSVAGPAVQDLLPGHWIDLHMTVDDVIPLGRLTVEVGVTPTSSGSQPLEGAIAASGATTTVWAPPFATLLLLVVLAPAAWLARRRIRALRNGRGSRLPYGVNHGRDGSEHRSASPGGA